uniref:Uncharacterized protein n=1 Tax=Panagrolaimus superbus TaxID=310955 RepID=A0A914Z947_9BILA
MYLISINDRNRTLQLLDILSPPRSFTDAIEVLTIEQKSHIQELFNTSRYQDLSIVVNGLIKSLPDADQRQIVI